MSTSRETVRDEVVVLLVAALVGVGLPVKTVTGSKPTDLEGLTPLVTVLSAGTKRMRQSFTGDTPTFYLEIRTYVRQACTGWTNAQAEDALDEIEALIAGVFESNRTTGYWEALEYNGPSHIIEMPVGGIAHYIERTPALAKLAKS